VMVNYAKTVLTDALPEAWLYVLGALFVVVTLFLPRGVVGLMPDLQVRIDDLRARRARLRP